MAKIVEEKNIHIDLKAKKPPDLNGIDGWLIFILLGLVLNISDLVVIFVDIFVNNMRHIISLDLFVIFITLINMLLYIFLLITMMKKLYFFPKLFFIILIGLNSLGLIMALFYSLSFDLLTLAPILITIVWLIYLKKSKRVRNTFIYNWKGEIIKKLNSDEQAE